MTAALVAALLVVGSPASPPSPSPSAAAPAASPLTLAQAVDFAAGHNQNVLAAKAQWMQAGAALARDRGVQLPLLQGSAQNTMNRQSASSAGSLAQFGLIPQPNFSQNTAQVQGSMSVFDLQNELTADQARHSYDAAAQHYRLVREQTRLDVETAYYTYVQDVDLAAIARGDLAYQQVLSDIANANYRTGRVAGIDRLKAQVQLTSSQENLASSAADAEDARENLAQLIGADIAQTFVVPAAIAAPAAAVVDVNALDAIALVHRPDVAIARDDLDNAVLAGGLVDAPNRPTVALTGAVGNQAVPTNIAANLRQPTDTPPGCGAPYCLPTHFYTIALNTQLTLPLLDWGTLHAAHRSASAEIDAQTAAYQAARRQVVIDVDQAYRRFGVDLQNLVLATQNADVARQAAHVAQVQYRVGLASQLDVTAAEQAYLQAAKQLLAAQIGCVLAADKLKLATGTLVTE